MINPGRQSQQWEALTKSVKNRPETMTIQITASGIPVDPYYFGEEDCNE